MRPLKINVEGVEYRVTVLPWTIPYINLIGVKMGSVPSSEREAKEISEAIKTAWEVIKKHITPEPSQEHLETLLFKLVREVAEEIRKAVRDANFTSENPATA